jgi:hypothetical protein
MTFTRPKPFAPYPRIEIWESAGLAFIFLKWILARFSRRSTVETAPDDSISFLVITSTFEAISIGDFPKREASTITGGRLVVSASADANNIGFIFLFPPHARVLDFKTDDPHSGFHGCATVPDFHRAFRIFGLNKKAPIQTN